MPTPDIKQEGLLPIGTLLGSGRYRIEQHLASGGFGKTYLAVNTNFDERVAIKELYIKGVCGRGADGNEVTVTLTENVHKFAQQQEKFRKEAKRLRSLVHTNIVRVHDLFDENGTSYYVMDYIDGESIGTMMKRTQQPMPEEQVMSILSQLLDALESVHAENIWHLDLKPGNIMLDKQGNAILIDFGTSKQFENKNGDQVDTSTTLAFTPGYAPSEQMEQNFEKFGPWTDIYALGATIYRMLTNNSLPTPTDIDENPTEALPFPDGISQKTRDLIFWMMKPLRTRRPQNIAEIRAFLAEAEKPKEKPEEKLEEVGDDDTVLAGFHTTPEQSDTEDDPTVAPSLTEAGTSEKKPEQKPEKPEEKPQKPEPEDPPHIDMFPTEPTPQNSKKKWIIGVAVAAIIGIVGGIFFAANRHSDSTVDTEKLNTDTVSTVTDLKVDLVASYTGNEANPDSAVFHTLGRYTYTGEVIDGMPNGTGRAKFNDGRTYEGTFKDGICEGTDITFTFKDGDIFKGSMKNNEFAHGRYTVYEGGSYFEGDFRNGDPYNGTWYRKDGSVEAKVVNGK